tara:strand:- start:319 stop:534 length:216 start_codon:yes stop_codon:yes gene_type:complete
MGDLIIMRAAHVVAVVVRIGGLALETMVLLPNAASADAPPELFNQTKQFLRPCAYLGFGGGCPRILYGSRA